MGSTAPGLVATAAIISSPLRTRHYRQNEKKKLPSNVNPTARGLIMRVCLCTV